MPEGETIMFRFMNNVKTAMLLAALMGLFAYVGSFWGQNGMVMALMLGGLMNFVAYFFSDKIALISMGAQPLSREQAPEIFQMVESLARRAMLPMPKVYVSPTNVPNAFATGRNPNHSAVCLTQGIIQSLDREELEGVIGHELSHIKHRDILISTIAATIAGSLSWLAHFAYFLPMGSRDDDERGNPLVGLLMIILAPIAAALIQMAISRKREYNADSYSAELTKRPMALATALEKLHYGNKKMRMELSNPAQANMFIVEPFTGESLFSLFSTHPAVEKRVQALIGRPKTGRI
jgi:heat shock protein HtpX